MGGKGQSKKSPIGGVWIHQFSGTTHGNLFLAAMLPWVHVICFLFRYWLHWVEILLQVFSERDCKLVSLFTVFFKWATKSDSNTDHESQVEYISTQCLCSLLTAVAYNLFTTLLWISFLDRWWYLWKGNKRKQVSLASQYYLGEKEDKNIIRFM